MAEPCVNCCFQECLEEFNSKYHTNFQDLKPLQKQALSCLTDTNLDLICMLPTGYGKSLIYELVPILFKLKFDKSSVVVVLEPLNIIIQQQLLKLGSDSTCITENLSESDLHKLKQGDFTYIFSHPEHLIGNKQMYKFFSMDVYQSKSCFIIVDEAHCVLDWGEDYRPMFREIKQLRALLPNAKVIALSATLSTKGQKEISKHLLMKNFRVVASEPTRDNISLLVLRRPPLTISISSKEIYDYVFLPLFRELKSKGQNFPLTILYCSGTMDWVGYGFEVATKLLGEDLYVGNPTPENQRVVMYHSSIEKGDKLKNIIFGNLSKPPMESPLKIVLATVAMGMGADLRYVARVIHVGPPKNMEAYIQQVGRAGRSGEQCSAVLFFNNADVGRPGVDKSVKDYCKNDTTCRKSTINSYFGFPSENDTPTSKCCDICQPDLKTEWQFETPLDERKKCVLRRALNAYIKSSGLENVMLPIHVEKLVYNAIFYTEACVIKDDFSCSEMLANTLSTIISQILEQVV